MDWQEAAKRLNIPADRVELVKRNVELRVKLKAMRDALTSFVGAHHEVYEHPEPFATCTRPTCVGVRDILERTKP